MRERPAGSGVWEVRAYAGRDPVTGKPKQVSRTVRGGRRKAEDVLRALQTEVGDGDHRATEGTVAFLLERYMEQLDGKGRSPSTLNHYRSSIDHTIVPELGEVALRDLRAARLDDFYTKLRQAGKAPATIRQHHAIVAGALQQALRWGWVTSNVARLASPPTVVNADPVPPTVDEVRLLLQLAERRDPAMAVLLFVASTTGARRGELCGLRWSNVDVDRRRLTIARNVVDVPGRLVVKDTKTHRVRRLALDDATAAALVVHREQQSARAETHHVDLAGDPFIFSRDLSGLRPAHPDSVTSFFRRIRQQAGCDHIHLHHLRHFMATHALAAGMDIRTVAGRLGHANPAITLRVYGHFLEERDRELADSMGRLLAPIRSE